MNDILPGTPRQPSLIVVGGYAGTGKTTLSKRLAAGLGLPRLGSDDLGQSIKRSKALEGHDVDAKKGTRCHEQGLHC
jgi:predicted kinase